MGFLMMRPGAKKIDKHLLRTDNDTPLIPYASTTPLGIHLSISVE